MNTLSIINYQLSTIISALLIAAPLQAQTPHVLTLEQARAMAAEHNKDVAIQQTQLEKTTFDARAMRSNFYPRLSLQLIDLYSTASGSFSINGGHLPIYTLNAASGTYTPAVTPAADGSYTLTQYADFPTQKIKYKLRNIFGAGLILQQPIYMGGKITSAYRMAQLGTQMAAEGVRLSRQQSVVDADRAYVQAVEAHEMQAVAQSYEDLLRALLHDVESAVRHGMRTRNDLMKVQVKLNEAEQASLKANNAYVLARMNLCHIIGQPLTSQFDVDTVLPLPSAQASGEAHLSARPEAAVYEQRVRLQQENVRLQRSDYLPNVALFAGGTYVGGGQLSGHTALDELSAAVGVSVKVPILTFGESANKLRSARAQQRIAQLEQQDIDEKLALELQQAANALSEARQELEIALRSREQAAENLRLSRKQYEVGYETLSDLLDAQSIWQSAYASEVKARCQLFLAHTLYAKAAGQME